MHSAHWIDSVSAELNLMMLCMLVLLGGANLGMCVLLWSRQGALSERITRVEVHQQAALTNQEVRTIHERISAIEGRQDTTVRMLQTIQDHLLESDS